MNFDFQAELNNIDRAAHQARNSMSGMRTFEGHPLHEPSVMAEKTAAALQPLQAAVQAAYDLADRANSEADRLDAAAYLDPLASVDNETLQRMGLLAPFVREQIAEETQISLANRLRGVVAHGDPATQHLYLRYAKADLGVNGGARVQKLLDELDEVVHGKERANLAKSIERAQSLRADAVGLRMAASDKLAEVSGKKDADMERRRQAYAL
ncbi:MAG: hypothetical protein R2867_42095 [Caldilineaceae bacterium]